MLGLAFVGLMPVASAGRVGGKLVPSSGTLMGAYVNPYNQSALSVADHEKLVRDFESLVGRKLNVEMEYYHWDDDFWDKAARWDLQNGRVPLVKYGAGTVPSLNSIINGSQDSTLRTLADGAKSLGKDFFFCFFWEMNGDWEAWSGAHNNDSGTRDGPLKYIKAWRHVHDIFVQRGATNAVWVWAPDKGDNPKDNWNHWLKYYPGDSYVDWVGIDGYNWGSAGSSWGSEWTSFEDTFRPFYDDFDGRKPMMIAETASAESGGDKAQWMADAQAAIKARLPNLSAVVWFDDNKETDWRVNSSTRSLNAYKTWLLDPYFFGAHGRPSSRGLPTISGRPVQGTKLSGANGYWAGSPNGFTYQWKRCKIDGGSCYAVSGATGLSYTLTSGDVGSTIRLFVTAGNSSGSAVVASDPTDLVASSSAGKPTNVEHGWVTGTFEQGARLLAHVGRWKGAPTSYSYQWRRCDSGGSNCSNISGATGSKYVLVSSDVGRIVKVVITAKNPAGSDGYTASSRLVYGNVPGNISKPSVSGSARVSYVLTLSKGSWTGSPTSYLYRWRRCSSTGSRCIDIAGATSSSYKVVSADRGFTIRGEVIASNKWGSAYVDSTQTSSVP